VTWAKICGVTNAGDARAVQAAGADFIGLILSDGFGRSVDSARAAEVVADIVTPRVAVLVDETPAEAAVRAQSIGASVLQLHGDEHPESVVELRALGDWEVWKAVRARSIEDVLRAVDTYGEFVSGLLVEGWREGAVGGAGALIEIDAKAVRAAVPSGLTFVLAGGLVPSEVAGTVARFSPDVIDVSSGVERSPGKKDHELVTAFIREAHRVSVATTKTPEEGLT
jgi:phosphoribosylanthranilate isomerase